MSLTEEILVIGLKAAAVCRSAAAIHNSRNTHTHYQLPPLLFQNTRLENESKFARGVGGMHAHTLLLTNLMMEFLQECGGISHFCLSWFGLAEEKKSDDTSPERDGRKPRS